MRKADLPIGHCLRVRQVGAMCVWGMAGGLWRVGLARHCTAIWPQDDDLAKETQKWVGRLAVANP